MEPVLDDFEALMQLPGMFYAPSAWVRVHRDDGEIPSKCGVCLAGAYMMANYPRILGSMTIIPGPVPATYVMDNPFYFAKEGMRETMRMKYAASREPGLGTGPVEALATGLGHL